MLADAFSPQLNNAGDPQALLRTLRATIKGSLIAAGNLTLESAQAHLDSGLLQLAVFGRPFIANPDLVERFQSGAPLAARARSCSTRQMRKATVTIRPWLPDARHGPNFSRDLAAGRRMTTLSLHCPALDTP